MNESEFKNLLEKYRLGACTVAERALLESWYLSQARAAGESIDEESLANAQRRIAAAIEKNTGLLLERQVRVINPWYRMVAAAAVLFLLSIGTYFIIHRQQPQQIVHERTHDIPPGSNKAVLTLADGKTIVLDNAKKGVLAKQEGTTIAKTADGHLSYENAGVMPRKTAVTGYNMIATPRGGQYEVSLPDGSKVWLNAASSLRYPVAFTGNERKVELTGEAYFEVAHDKAKPFRVLAGGQKVEVLGTHFNINAYPDEPAITTTLLEGSVRVSNASRVLLLKPGEQASSSRDDLTARQADMEEAVAWKNGYFRFNDEKIESVMRKLSRWYNIDVQFTGQASGEGYYGKISRYRNISDVLKMLEQTKGIHFTIEERRVTVHQ